MPGMPPTGLFHRLYPLRHFATYSNQSPIVQTASVVGFGNDELFVLSRVGARVLQEWLPRLLLCNNNTGGK